MNEYLPIPEETAKEVHDFFYLKDSYLYDEKAHFPGSWFRIHLEGGLVGTRTPFYSFNGRQLMPVRICYQAADMGFRVC